MSKQEIFNQMDLLMEAKGIEEISIGSIEIIHKISTIELTKEEEAIYCEKNDKLVLRCIDFLIEDLRKDIEIIDKEKNEFNNIIHFFRINRKLELIREAKNTIVNKEHYDVAINKITDFQKVLKEMKKK